MVLTTQQIIMVAIACAIEPWIVMGIAWLVLKIKDFMRKEEF